MSSTGAVLREGNWEFEFAVGWQALNYDESGSDYRKRVKLDKMCGVDLLAAHGEQPRLLLIEVKDFTGHFKENASRLDGELWDETAWKVRDTIAGIVGLHHTASGVSIDQWAPFHRALALRKLTTRFDVILWLEGIPERLENQYTGWGKRLKKRLSWLTPRVQVCHHRGRAPDTALVQVSRVPEPTGRGGPRTLPGQ